MRRRYVAGVVLSVLLFLADARVADRPLTVLMGRLTYVQEKNKKSLEHDRSLYIHENLQFVVVRVERVIVGSEIEGEVVVGVSIDETGLPGLRRLSPSYAVLSPVVWHKGAKVVMAVETLAQSEEGCFPPAWRFGPSTPRPEGLSPSETVVLDDEQLQQFVRGPFFCASGRNVFVIREEGVPHPVPWTQP